MSKTFADLKEAAARAAEDFEAQTVRVRDLTAAGNALADGVRMFRHRCTCREGRCLECAYGVKVLEAWRKALL